MQFYIIDLYQVENAKKLPAWALRVNIREGWQILSDIGHATGISWEGQNREYNRYHANTWRFWKTKEDFLKFYYHYKACLDEYKRAYKIKPKYLDFIGNVPMQEILDNINTDSEEKSVIKYMLERKSKNMSVEEIDIMKNLLTK